jgi:hypothetical protein
VSDTQHTEGTDEQQWTGGYHHIVVLMLENRSFDHMLGFPYADSNSVSPAGRPFDGLSGQESNTDGSGKAVAVFKIQSTSNNACFMPAANPGEGYSATSSQLFGALTAPTPPQATNQGSVTDFAYTLGWESREGQSILPGTAGERRHGPAFQAAAAAGATSRSVSAPGKPRAAMELRPASASRAADGR